GSGGSDEVGEADGVAVPPAGVAGRMGEPMPRSGSLLLLLLGAAGALPGRSFCSVLQPVRANGNSQTANLRKPSRFLPSAAFLVPPSSLIFRILTRFAERLD